MINPLLSDIESINVSFGYLHGSICAVPEPGEEADGRFGSAGARHVHPTIF